MSQINPGRVLSFTEHLEEFRVRLIICVVWSALCFLVCLLFAPRIVQFLIAPITGLDTPPPPGRSVVLRLEPNGQVHFAGVATDGGPTADAPLSTATLSGIVHDRFRIEMPFGAPAIEGGARQSVSRLVYLSPIEPIMLLIKGALLASALAILPMVLYQLWLFIAPGLMRRERKAVKSILISALFLFPIGALFAYAISGLCLKVLISFGNQVPGLEPNITAAKAVGLILALMLACGVIFEFPLVLVLLARMGIVSSALLVRKRKLAVVIISVVSAVATPTPDPFTMLMLLIPLLVLYEGSVMAIRAMERARALEESLPLGQKSVDA